MLSPRVRARLGLLICAVLFGGSFTLLMRNAISSPAPVSTALNDVPTQFAASLPTAASFAPAH